MKVQDRSKLDSMYSSMYSKMHNMSPNFNKDSPWESVQWIRSNYPSWQYNGVEEFEDIMLWCEEHFGDWWVWSNETIYFWKEADRTMFLLKWS